MMRALFSGVTGLRSHQTKMDVIGNNISNVNTLGYKKSAANFADIYSETVSPSSAPSANNGGINARQVGLGVQLTSIQIKHNPGAAQYTGNTLDLAIQGDGFFAVRTNADGRERYTRAGNLSISSNGSLVTSAGNFVQCFTAQYKAGDAGVVSSNGFPTNTDPSKNVASGINTFTYTPDYGGIVTTASGTYTLELGSDNTTVRLMKNGIAVGDPISIKELNGPEIDRYTGFKPNTTYQIDLSEAGVGLGEIRFTTEGHRVNENLSGLAIPGISAEFTQGEKDAVDAAQLGAYSLVFSEDGTASLVTGSEENDNLQALTATVTLTKADGTEGDWTLDAGVDKNDVLQIATDIGTIKVRFTSALDAAGLKSTLESLHSGATITLIQGAGEGPDNFTTGLASLNGLLTGASISVMNNDAFQATATRGDMIINQDLFENISINEEGAVIGQLKANTTGALLEAEAGIIGAEDMAAGEKVVLGYIALATFSNTEGLEKVGTNLYEMTSNSGRVMYNVAGTGGTGTIAASSLEMSNVDLSEEMVNMITTQRGFQANSRIITTTDTMLEELINLKR